MCSLCKGRKFFFRVLFTTSLAVLSLAVLVTPSVLAQGAKLRAAPTDFDHPVLDASAFYAFRSYEPGRSGFVTFIANYNPLQTPDGAPLFYPLNERALYDIHVDSDGDGMEDLTFRFRFEIDSPFLGVPVAEAPGGGVPIGISNVFPAGPGSPPPGAGGAPPADQRINWRRTYTLRILRGPADKPDQRAFVVNADTGERTFEMPFDYIGPRSFPDYPAYAAQFIFDIDIPDCGEGRVFVGQRQESYAFNRGDFYDLVGIPDIVGPRDARPNPLSRYNVTSLALEVPIDCLTASGDVIGTWTTASLLRFRRLLDDPTFDDPDIEKGDFAQVFRLGNPFINEAEIGLPDKNLFNTTHPANDLANFGLYFNFPSIPVGIALVSQLNQVNGTGGPLLPAPTNIPRTDLVAFYLQGLPGLNANGAVGDQLRLNTAIPARPAAMQNDLGWIDGDNAGFPNGRRPGDDVIDITMRVLEGVLCYQNLGFCTPVDAPAGDLPLTDQTGVDATEFQEAFPYLNTPLPGAGS